MLIGESSAKARTISTGEKEGTIQHGWIKWGTHARVFSETLAHGNIKNEIRQAGEECKERREYGKK